MELAYQGSVTRKNYFYKKIGLNLALSSRGFREYVKLNWDDDERAPVAKINLSKVPGNEKISLRKSIGDLCLEHNFMIRVIQ
ncbi:MAG: hypothetical protein PVJ67_06690 [Candidatus Pacearchaeota archaeon]|jgi:hypothetical protein